MDILAARKKAAERALEQKSKERETAAAEADVPAPNPAPKPDVAPADQKIAASEPESAVVPATAVPAGPCETGTAAGTGEQSAMPESQVPEALSEPQVQELELLSFRLGSEEYAVPVDDVKEVLKNRDLTNVPNAPDHILGVTSLRGPILPVVDLRKRLGLPAGTADEKTRILVVTLNNEDAGVVVDRVTGVVRIHPGSVRPVPETIEHGAEYLKGIARKDDRLYILLDIEKALGV